MLLSKVCQFLYYESQVDIVMKSRLIGWFLESLFTRVSFLTPQLCLQALGLSPLVILFTRSLLLVDLIGLELSHHDLVILSITYSSYLPLLDSF